MLMDVSWILFYVIEIAKPSRTLLIFFIGSSPDVENIQNKTFPNISKWFKETVTKDWKNKATTVIPLSELGPGCAGGFGPKLQVLPPPFHVSPSSNCWDILEQSKKIQSGDPTDWRGNIVIHRVMPLPRRRTCWSFSCCSFWWQECAFIYYFWG